MADSFTPAKFNWWWDAIIDLMLAEPELTKKEIALRLNCTPAYIYMITGCDLFTARLSQRRAALNDDMQARIAGRLTSVADRSLSLIADVLEKKRDAIPLPTLLELSKTTLDKLGYGVKPSGVQVNVNGAPGTKVGVTITLDELNEARAALARSEQAKVIEHQPALGRGPDQLLVEPKELQHASPPAGVDGEAAGPELEATVERGEP